MLYVMMGERNHFLELPSKKDCINEILQHEWKTRTITYCKNGEIIREKIVNQNGVIKSYRVK